MSVMLMVNLLGHLSFPPNGPHSMWCPIVMGLPMCPLPVGYSGSPYSLSAEIHESKSRSYWDSYYPRPLMGRASLLKHGAGQRKPRAHPYSGRRRGSRVSCTLGDKELLMAIFGDYLLHSLLLPSPILSILPNTAMCIFELLPYICHKLVVINDSCLSPAPTFILWFSLHLGLMSVLPILLPCLVVQFMATLKCCQNTTSLLTELAVMCTSSPSFRTQLNLTSSINSLLILLKNMEFLSF